MTEFLQAHLLSGWTPGAAGVWTLVLLFLLGWWKGLPGVIAAFATKQAGVESRVNELLDAQSKRFQAQLKAADERHEECMEGQRKMQDAMEAKDRRRQQEIDALRAENSRLWDTINGMKQGVISTQRVIETTIRDARAQTNGGTA